MKKQKNIYLIILLLSILLFRNMAGVAYAYTNTHRAPIDAFIERYNADEDFKAYVNFGAGVLFLAALISGISGYLGVSLAVLWAFIGGFVLMEIFMVIAAYFLKFNLFSIYGFFASFGVAIWCAFYVHSRWHS